MQAYEEELYIMQTKNTSDEWEFEEKSKKPEIIEEL
jgi:hypothetical protein